MQRIESFQRGRESQTVQGSLLDAKGQLLLVEAGVKPATDLDVYGDFAYYKDGHVVKPFDEHADEMLTNEIARTQEFLNAIALYSKASTSRISELISADNSERISQVLTSIYVAKSQEALEELFEAFESGDHRRIGLALGYPESAVDAFMESHQVSLEDIAPKLKASEWAPFARFKLSPENWLNEIEVVKKWAEIVRINSPKIFNELVHNQARLQPAKAI